MKIILFIISVVFFIMVVFFLETDKVIKTHTSYDSYERNISNQNLLNTMNELFIDSPNGDLFLYSRLISDMDDRGMKSIREYDFNLMKINIEKVLEPYLESKNLFPKFYFDEHRMGIKKDEWTNFIRGSLVYIEYLNSIGEENKANKILKKNIYYTKQRILNSQIMIDYIGALYNYNTLYRHIKENSLFKKYLLPEPSIFFQKLKNEKEYILSIYVKSLNSKIAAKYNTDKLVNNAQLLSKYKQNFLDKIKSYLRYYDRLGNLIKEESSAKIKVFYEEIEMEKNSTTDELKYNFLLGFPTGYVHMYNMHKKIYNSILFDIRDGK